MEPSALLVALLLSDDATDPETWRALGPLLPGPVATAVWQTHPSADAETVDEHVDGLDVTRVPYDRALPLHTALRRSSRSSLASALLDRADPGAVVYLLTHADPVPAPVLRWLSVPENAEDVAMRPDAHHVLAVRAAGPGPGGVPKPLVELVVARLTALVREPTAAPGERLRAQLALTVHAARTSTPEWTLGQLRAALELAGTVHSHAVVDEVRRAANAGGDALAQVVAEVLAAQVGRAQVLGVLPPAALGLDAHELTAGEAAAACHAHPVGSEGWWDLALRALAGGTPGPAHLVAVGARPPAGVLVELVTTALAGAASGGAAADLVLHLAAHLRGRDEPEAERARQALLAAAEAPDAGPTVPVAAALLVDPVGLAARPLDALAAAAGPDTGQGTGAWVLAAALVADPEVRTALAALRDAPDGLDAALRRVDGSGAATVADLALRV
ncbi:hypothetical protein [Cellulomonas endophytica]|uniref:hypothetical protein n=1 Tax=Cellulomonas endophytica TaxID=2494735 RepID=UPI0010120C87|nr:hypothetical protein [Cellulomonas endophytica]